MSQSFPVTERTERPAPDRAPDGPLKGLVRWLDKRMRRGQGLIEFSSASSCILRVSRCGATETVSLTDGSVIRPGDVVLDIHFWNEHLPQAPSGLAFGGRFGRLLSRSIGELARAIEADPRFADAVAVRGRLAFAGARNAEDVRRFGAWFGFEAAPQARLPLGRRIHDAFEDIWLFLLTWTFNPGALRGRSLRRRREDLWISRERLVEKYRLQPGRRAKQA